MKIAICFYGLCRSTHYTSKSIIKNMYNILDNDNIEYDIYLHTYSINKEYNNKWSGEKNIKINNDNWKLLNPSLYLIEDEDVIIKQLDLVKYRTHGDPWAFTGDNTFNALNNVILTLYSIYQVTQLWKNSSTKYDSIIYLRPDILYIKPIDIKIFNQIKDNTIFLPNFEQFPVNDRFAIGDPLIMQIYGERFKDAYDYSLRYPLAAEEYLSYILEKNRINIVKIDYIFLRIRMNGTSPDNQYLNNYNGFIISGIIILIVLFIMFYKIYYKN